MKKNQQATAQAISLIDAYFMQVWRKRHTEANGFTRTGEDCRKMTRTYTILVITSTILLMISTIVAPIILMSDWFGIQAKIVASAMILASLGLVTCTFFKKPGDRVLKVGHEWDWAREEAIKFGIVRVMAGCIEDSHVSLKNEVAVLLSRIASDIHRHEADESKWRKKWAKNRFYRLYNFAKDTLGVELPATGEFLKKTEVFILAPIWE